jgi:TRAP-type C4-dicarboxylate transport system permease small subunit
VKLQKVRKSIGNVVNAVNYGAMIPLFLMVFVAAIDVILRKTQAGRIHGSNELTMYFMVWICMLGIPTLHFKDGHVWINMFVNKFPYRFRCFWRCAIMAAETAVIGLLAIGGYDKVMAFYTRSTTSDILNMPKWVFAAAGLVAFAEYFLLSLIDTIQFCVEGIHGEENFVDDVWNDEQVKGV